MNNQTAQLYEFGEYRLEASQGLLLRKGKVITLTPKALETLLVLVQNGGRLVSKEDLIKAVWADTFVEEGNLARNIWTLRKALGDDDTNRYIETVPKRGYRFVAPVTELSVENPQVIIQRRVRAHIVSEELEIDDPEAESQFPPVEVQPFDSVAARNEFADPSADLVTKRHGIGRMFTEGEGNGRVESESTVRTKALLTSGEKEVNGRPRLVLAALVLVLVGLTLALTYTWSSRRSPGPQTGATVRSLAVLPFKPIGAGNEDEYLGLGMADALITKLSNIREINTRPTSAVRKYNAPHQDPVAAGRELRVDAVIEGSVQRVGEQLRVTVQLVSVQDGAPLWADKFDEQFTSIFAVQDRISEQVARALAPKLSLEERRQLNKRYTENVEAYQDYLKGRFFWNKRTGEDMRKGIEYFEQAIRKDPNYALAYAGLADSYNVLSQFGELAPDDAMPRANAAALRALEIDDTVAEAHASLAMVHNLYDWNWLGAEKESKRAIELNPNYANAHHWYAMFLSATGRHDEALAEIRRAKEIDPVSLIISTNEGWILFCARKYDSAIEQLRKTIELDSGFANAHYKLALVYEAKGMYKEAVEAYLKDDALSGTSPGNVALSQAAFSKSGWRGYCEQQLNELKNESKQGYVSPKYFVLAYLQLGEKDLAFEWLEKAYQERGEVLLYLKVDPRFDPLRSDPRFAEMLRRVGHTP